MEEKYSKKHYLETNITMIYYMCELAYQTMHEPVRFVKYCKDDITLALHVSTSIVKDEEMPNKRRRLCDGNMIDVGNVTEQLETGA
eukprot:2899638-Heterocapsa_arctica.AAC.1